MVPQMTLIAARYSHETGAGAGPEGRAALEKAVELSDRILANRAWSAYAEKASLLKGRVLLENLRDPARALSALDEAVWSSPDGLREGEELKVQANLAAGRWEEAKRARGRRRIGRRLDNRGRAQLRRGDGDIPFGGIRGRSRLAVRDGEKVPLEQMGQRRPRDGRHREAVTERWRRGPGNLRRRGERRGGRAVRRGARGASIPWRTKRPGRPWRRGRHT